jgi:hypothetical protein
MRNFRIGLLYFQEAFSKELEFRLKQIHPAQDHNGEPLKFEVEHIPISEYNLDGPPRYDLVLDRASHYFPLGKSMFMMMAYRGTHIINNPFSFHYFISRKDMGYYMAHQLGVHVPETYVLPMQETPHFKKDDFVHHRHFNWNQIIERVGFPCFIKPANGRGARGVHECANADELLSAYEDSGTEVMVVQSKVDSPYPWQVRCLCLGRQILITKYIFRKFDQSEYLEDENFLSDDVIEQVVNQSRVINRSMGYEMNSVEFYLDENHTPWAIDFNNPIPDGRLEALGPYWYESYLCAMMQMILKATQRPDRPDFIPDVNPYANIARLDIPREKRFQKALSLANEYYQEEESSP